MRESWVWLGGIFCKAHMRDGPRIKTRGRLTFWEGCDLSPIAIFGSSNRQQFKEGPAAERDLPIIGISRR